MRIMTRIALVVFILGVGLAGVHQLMSNNSEAVASDTQIATSDCSALCGGTHENCKGHADGKCSKNCKGHADGKCDGKCSKNCKGHADGKCDGKCGENCKGHAEGKCDGKCGENCKGHAEGKNTEKCKGHGKCSGKK